jgi:hypothetical protein
LTFLQHDYKLLNTCLLPAARLEATVRGGNIVRKACLILAGVIAAAAIITGCQATPEEQIVVQKDMQQMVEKAASEDGKKEGATLAEYLNAPKTYTALFDGYNGSLTVNADAKVTIPDSEGISVTRVKKRYFTQEEADRMINVFLQGAELYKADMTLTKSEIQDILVRYYGIRDGSVPEDTLSAMGFNTDNIDEQLNKTIEDYERQLAAAPETKEQIPAETKFHASETALNPDARVIEGMATVNGRAAYLFINNGHSNVNDVEAVFVNSKQPAGGHYYSCPYTILSDKELAGLRIPETFTLTKEAAQSVGEGILKELGITDMTCSGIKYAVIPAQGMNNAAPEPKQLENGEWAYELRYQRTVNGIPITPTDYAGNSIAHEDDMSVPWPYESLKIIVDETGVVYFDYMSPYAIEDTVTDNASLLKFAKAASVFEKMFSIAFGYLEEEAADYRLQADITEVRLGLMRITEQNSRDSGLLIPVWDFYGEVTKVPDKGEPHKISDNIEPLLTINAIDGTVIDRGLGY